MTKQTFPQQNEQARKPRDFKQHRRRLLDAAAIVLTITAGVPDLADQQHLATPARAAAMLLRILNGTLDISTIRRRRSLTR